MTAISGGGAAPANSEVTDQLGEWNWGIGRCGGHRYQVPHIGLQPIQLSRFVTSGRALLVRKPREL